MEKRDGISLIEATIYIAIFAVVSIIVINMLLATVNAFGSARISRNINEQGVATLERMLREIRLATAVATTTSILGTNPGTLVLTTFVDHTSNATTTRRFYLQNGNAVMEDSLSPASFLTSGLVVTNLIFRRIGGGTVSEAVRVEMTIEGGTGRFLKSQAFYGTAVLRGRY